MATSLLTSTSNYLFHMLIASCKMGSCCCVGGSARIEKTRDSEVSPKPIPFNLNGAVFSAVNPKTRCQCKVFIGFEPGWLHLVKERERRLRINRPKLKIVWQANVWSVNRYLIALAAVLKREFRMVPVRGCPGWYKCRRRCFLRWRLKRRMSKLYEELEAWNFV